LPVHDERAVFVGASSGPPLVPHHAHAVVEGIGDVEVPVLVEGDAGGALEVGGPGRAAVADAAGVDRRAAAGVVEVVGADPGAGPRHRGDDAVPDDPYAVVLGVG